jgi:hypothetical protein
MPSVFGSRAVVVDWLGFMGNTPTEIAGDVITQRSSSSQPGRRCEPSFGFEASNHCGADRTERNRDQSLIGIANETRRGCRDDHGISGADLGITLPTIDDRHADRMNDLSGLECISLDAEHEIVP